MSSLIISLVFNLILLMVLVAAVWYQNFYKSRHDHLTGFFNGLTFDKMATRCINKSLTATIIIADINGLKLINENYSHYAGDMVISTVAGILRKHCRREDLIGRTSGGEFTIFMPCAGVAAARGVIRQILVDCLAAGLQVGGQPISISLSLGSATRLTPGQDLITLKRVAAENLCKRKLLESRSVHSTILSSLRKGLQSKSLETDAHADRMACLARNIGNLMNLTASELDHLELLAVMHDIGKVGIPDEILNKSGPLSQEEWEIMKRHPEIGNRIAAAFPELAPIADDILCHHERWDGTGYPRGLSQQAIPLPSRIVAVVDAFDAMTSDRPYRAAIDCEQALSEIRRCAGSQFDPDIVAVFMQLTYIFYRETPSADLSPIRPERQLLIR